MRVCSMFVRSGFLLTLLFLLVGFTFTPWAVAYNDIAGHWAIRDIELLTSQGIIAGYPDGNFRPDQLITRSEMAKIVVDALNMEPEAWVLKSALAVFRDVPASHWAKEYIQVAYELGLTNGYKDGTFRPDKGVQRDEMVTMLVRALRYQNASVPLTYKDAVKIPVWAQDSIAIASERGLIDGYPDGSFRPQQHATRAETTVIMSRFLLERGNCYDFYGILKQLNLTTMTAVLEISGRDTTLQLKKSCAVFEGTSFLSLEKVKAKKFPVPIYFNLDQNGDINFLQILSCPFETLINMRETVVALEQEQGPVREEDSLFAGDYSLQKMNAVSGQMAIKDPAKSLEITKKEMRVPGLTSKTGADGKGVVIAVIDTGTDPLHPDLQYTGANEFKIIDWQDFTGEGKVVVSETLRAGIKSLKIASQVYTIGDISSRSGFYRYGFLEEKTCGLDLDGDGALQGCFLVLLTDAVRPGVYDTVYVDADGDRSLRGETPLQVYRSSHSTGIFQDSFYGGGLGFVVCDLDSQGREVTLGFDTNGHGTYVAGVMAANGGIRGVAPGARLMVLKAVNNSGEADWSVLTKAIKYAADHGADIINLSVGSYRDNTAGNNTLTQLVDKISQEKGIVFTVAAGNQGPGIGSLTTPGNAQTAIGVGAYISPEMWRQDYGWEVPKESLWYYSSVGPRQDGLCMPVVIAPGSVVSTAPSWGNAEYSLVEGTSVAAPHAAGAVALLLESARLKGIQVNPEVIKQALAQGARPVDHFNRLEEGNGVLDVEKAWSILQRLPSKTPVQVWIYNKYLGFGGGLFARDFVPAQLSCQIKNEGYQPLRLFWNSSVDWIQPRLKETLVPGGLTRRLPLWYRLPKEPGLYVGEVTGDSPFTPGSDVFLLSTVTIPQDLTQENQYRAETSDFLEAGQFRRYFYRVPEGTGMLNVNLSVPYGSNGYQGRVRLHIIGPNGQQVKMTEYAGLGLEGTIVRGTVLTSIPNPQPGTWEVIAYSSASLSRYGRQDSFYRVIVQGRQVVPRQEEEGILHKHWLLGIVPKEIIPGRPTYLTLQVRDRFTKKPVDGVVYINKQLYEIKKGEVTFLVTPNSPKIELTLGS